jgi:hypothetical protein
MPQTDPTPDHSEGVVIFAQGDTYCAACAPREARRTFVETEVARLEPYGSALVWRAIPGPIANGPNPRACPYHERRLHWLLVRELRR